MASFRVHPLAVLCFAFLTAMCTGGTSDSAVGANADAGPKECTPGMLSDCRCPDLLQKEGKSGVRRCSESGTWQPCTCTGVDCVGSDVTQCIAPPSECRDSSTLRYYVKPTCENNRCQWATAYYPCQQLCSRGSCFGTSTMAGTGTWTLGDASSTDSQASDAARDAAKDAAKDAAGIDSSSPSVCTGADASLCQAPPSQCVSPALLRYYVNPTCTNSRCEWEVREYACTSCMNGGCLGTTTAGGAGP